MSQQSNPFTQQQDIYQEEFTELYIQDKAFEELDLKMDDDKLDKMLITSLEADRAH